MRWPVVVAVMLVLAACGEADGGGSAPAPDEPVSAPAEPSPPAAQPPRPAACERVGRRLLGRTLDSARSVADERRCPLRVAIEDGLELVLTDDFNPSRINVRVDDGEVTKVLGLY